MQLIYRAGLLLLFLSTNLVAAPQEVNAQDKALVEKIEQKVLELKKLKMEEMDLRRQIQEAKEHVESLSYKLDQHNAALEKIAS